jgi:hypothetical protein
MQIYYGVRLAIFPASDNALHKMEFARTPQGSCAQYRPIAHITVNLSGFCNLGYTCHYVRTILPHECAGALAAVSDTVTSATHWTVHYTKALIPLDGKMRVA